MPRASASTSEHTISRSRSAQARLCAKNSTRSTSPVGVGDFRDIPSVCTGIDDSLLLPQCVALSLYVFLSWISSEHLKQGDSPRSRNRPSAPSRPLDRLPELQRPDGNLAGTLTVVARGNAPTTLARSSQLKHTPESGAAIGGPLASVHQVGISTQVALWRGPGGLKSPLPASCSTRQLPSRVVSSTVLRRQRPLP